jgi:NADPH-dependent F420 reductase
MINDTKKIAVLGGTGNLGYALAWRWAGAGHEIIIGSRSEEKAQTAADELNEGTGKQQVSGADNLTAVSAAEIVVLTVPFSAHESTLETIKPGLSGQILIDTTVPLRPPKVTAAQLPAAGSAAQMTRDYLTDNARVVAAFHNISAKLLNKDTEIDCDILVTSDDPEARKEVLQLVGDAGCHGLDAGALANSAAAEALTSVLIHLNKTYKVGHAGIVITGLGN